MSRSVKVASTAGAFVIAGVAATLLSGRQRQQRRLRRGEDVEFGSVHSGRHVVSATDGVALNVEVDEGERKTPTIVFVHGWVETLDVWHYQRLALRGQVRMVFFDLRSHGLSGRSYHDSSSIPHLADDLRTIIRAEVPRGPVILVGHSMGGMAIMELAVTDPGLFGGRVKGVVLIGTSAGRLMRSSPGLRHLIPLLRIASPVLDWGRSFNSYTVVQRWGLGPDAQERHVDMTNEMILRAPTHVLMDFYSNFVGLDLTAGLKALGRADTVIIGGTADMLTPIKHSRRLAEVISGAKLVIVDGAGHMVPFEDHQRVTKTIADLLERIS
ncbi:alpha/beta hydrolase [Aeromicrobium sp.]|uniref:alpha/beta fold hydrolase n=1 Tax=Aeromicrobium sp. TaxID=1871063 RepID=UPI0019C3525A|nr:alpha/beta hydrolase [Aeromicrobium sp.]MBC7633737.1 alpha/beta hydrolase [Aeromicrobium sp.]